MPDVETIRAAAKETLDAMQPGLIGAGGGIVGYLVKVVHWGEKWSWPTLLVMYILAPYLMGHVIQDVWPNDANGKPYPGMGGTIAVLGTAGGVVLVAVQDTAIKVLKKVLAKAEKKAE